MNRQKIRWIVREMEKGERSVYRIAKIQQVSPRWVREIYNTYQETGEYLFPRQPGRKPVPLSQEKRVMILEVRKHHPVAG
ncbi:MAG: hypothetical protein KKG04_09060, partial [Candidatus Thermoplasmatota archaeon]|nr:hypothetical protein [Candidatus Thermoplasmatota archaeon]